MAKFVIYTYQFAPLFSDLQTQDSLFDEVIVPAKDEIMYTKQKVFTDLFKTEDAIEFRVGEEVFRHRLLLNYNGIIAFRIANNKVVWYEENFKVQSMPDQPSCLVLIDNRENCQNIAIQKLTHSFASTDRVARILNLAFNEHLKKHYLTMEIRRRYEEKTFWNLVDKYPDGIKGIKFSFSYPNLPRVSDNVGELFVELGKQFNASSKFELNAIEGQALNLDNNDSRLKSLVKSAGDSGLPIKVLPVQKGARWISTGSSSCITTEIAESSFIHEEGDIFDDRYESLAEIMNEFKK